jgi:hypothetical protein
VSLITDLSLVLTLEISEAVFYIAYKHSWRGQGRKTLLRGIRVQRTKLIQTSLTMSFEILRRVTVFWNVATCRNDRSVQMFQ